MKPESSSVWVDQGEARELLFAALSISFGDDLANLIIGIEASGNPRPLAGLSVEQLSGVTRQLDQIGAEIRHTLAPLAQAEFEVSLDAAQEIVAAEVRAKAGAPPAG
jgi:hypothetical protein